MIIEGWVQVYVLETKDCIEKVGQVAKLSVASRALVSLLGVDQPPAPTPAPLAQQSDRQRPTVVRFGKFLCIGATGCLLDLTALRPLSGCWECSGIRGNVGFAIPFAAVPTTVQLDGPTDASRRRNDGVADDAADAADDRAFVVLSRPLSNDSWASVRDVAVATSSTADVNERQVRIDLVWHRTKALRVYLALGEEEGDEEEEGEATDGAEPKLVLLLDTATMADTDDQCQTTVTLAAPAERGDNSSLSYSVSTRVLRRSRGYPGAPGGDALPDDAASKVAAPGA